jgi:hypothetical protein
MLLFASVLFVGSLEYMDTPPKSKPPGQLVKLLVSFVGHFIECSKVGVDEGECNWTCIILVTRRRLCDVVLDIVRGDKGQAYSSSSFIALARRSCEERYRPSID